MNLQKTLGLAKTLLLTVLLSLATTVSLAQGRPGHHEGQHGGQHGVHHEGPERHEHRRPPIIECATPEQMQMVLQTLDNQSFDDKKLEIVKLCVTLGRFCTDDLARMAEKFSFDDNRKVFLIYAYSFCEDPQNYYALKDVFSFRSNFDEMMEKVMPAYRR